MSKDLHRRRHAGTFVGGMDDRCESAGAGRSIASSAATAAIVTRGAATRAERAREAAELDPGGLEAQP